MRCQPTVHGGALQGFLRHRRERLCLHWHMEPTATRKPQGGDGSRRRRIGITRSRRFAVLSPESAPPQTSPASGLVPRTANGNAAGTIQPAKSREGASSYCCCPPRAQERAPRDGARPFRGIFERFESFREARAPAGKDTGRGVRVSGSEGRNDKTKTSRNFVSKRS